jgi:hypothetical protein
MTMIRAAAVNAFMVASMLETDGAAFVSHRHARRNVRGDALDEEDRRETMPPKTVRRAAMDADNRSAEKHRPAYRGGLR